MRSAFAGFIALTLASTVLTHAEENPPEPAGYRTDNYRAPVPATLAGARVLATEKAEGIWRSGSGVFVDVLPRPPKPANLPASTIWRDKPRVNIPGSIWLPDTGYGELAPATESYLRRGLVEPRGAARQSCSSSTARPIAGCHGMRPSEQCPTAIQTLPGIRKELTAGNAPSCHWRNLNRSRGKSRRHRHRANLRCRK